MWVFQTKTYTSLIYTSCIRFNMKSYITNSTTIQFITIDNRLKRVHNFELRKCLNRVLCCMFDCLHHIKEFYMYIAFTQSGIDNEIYLFFFQSLTLEQRMPQNHTWTGPLILNINTGNLSLKTADCAVQMIQSL